MTGLRVEVDDAAPFVIATGVGDRPVVATNGSQALVTWSQYLGSRAAFLTAAHPEQPGPSFPIGTGGSLSSVTTDGSDFVLVRGRIEMLKISGSGTISEPTPLRLDEAEISSLPAVAASGTLPPLLAFLQRHTGSESVPRTMVMFASELDDEPASPPQAPTNVCASANGDGTTTVSWQSPRNILGNSIEVELPDGTFRQIAVAAAGATSARVSLPGLEGETFRVRSWNAHGLSAPSPIAGRAMRPQAEMRWSAVACAGVPETIEIELTGTPPFNIHWHDGLLQRNVTTNTVTRVVTMFEDTVFTIATLTDASCLINEEPESIRFDVTPQPAIASQPHAVRVSSGQTATLTVTANEGARFAWFEGPRGDTTRPVGGNSAAFTTPPLSRATQYWVRVSNRCGSVDSQPMTVAVSGKRRSARR